MSQPAPNQDFQPIPQYTDDIRSNRSWVAVTMTKTVGKEVTQVQIIIPKR